jgi:formamidopyrimidine-DNA glycosylase
MPELPDVEIFKRYLDATSLHQRIEKVTAGPARILDGITAKALAERLTGQSLTGTRRHGKHLFAALSGGGALGLHFGMTGYPAYGRGNEVPDHTRLRLDFPGGYHLAYVNQRLLGRVRLIDDVKAFIEDEGLGPDALAVDADRLAKMLEGRRGQIKGALMDQGFIAGLGNVYVDEMLFQAGLHPKTPVGRMDREAIGHLHRALRHVLTTAIDRGAGTPGFEEHLPDSWLLPRREEGRGCPRCDGRIEKITVGGRAGYYCPACQSAA